MFTQRNRIVSMALACAFVVGMIVGPQRGSMQDAPDPSAPFTSPLEPAPPGTIPPGTIPPPAAAPVVQPEPRSEAVVEKVATPGIYRMLARRLNLPLAAVQRMSDRAVEELVERNSRLLQMDVYRRIDGELRLVATSGVTLTTPARNRVRLNPAAPDVSATADPNASPDPTADPTASPAPVAEDAQVTAAAASTTYRMFLPLIAADITAAEIQDAITAAYQFLFRVSNFETSYGYVKEYVGYPLWIKNASRPTDATYPRLVGHYYQTHAQALGKVVWYAVGYDAEYMHVTFEEAYDWNYGSPFVWAHRYYTPNNVRYEVSVRSFGGSENVTLYLHNYQVWTRGEAVPKTVSYTVTDGFPAHRYTIRHAVMLGQKLYDANYQTTQKAQLETTAGAFGFYRDIYDPLFKERTFLPDDFMFLDSAYHDCDWTLKGVQSSFFWGVYPNTTTPQFGRYGYESKVCSLGRATYIALSRQDYLGPALQAIHVLNKTNNPDAGYANPNYPVNGLPATVTPRQMARWLEANGWNGYGIKIWGKDAAYASGVRTNAFLVLETLLGYKFGDATSITYADAAARVLLDTEWAGNPAQPGLGQTTDDGAVLRPQHRGGQLLAWVRLGAGSAVVAAASVDYGYGLPPRTLLNDVIDFFSMPKEVEGVVPTNSESTLTYIQALRVYLRYRFGVNYPSANWLP